MVRTRVLLSGWTCAWSYVACSSYSCPDMHLRCMGERLAPLLACFTGSAGSLRPSAHTEEKRSPAVAGENGAVAALDRGIAREVVVLAEGDEIVGGAVDDELPGVHEHDLGAGGGDVLDEMRADEDGRGLRHLAEERAEDHPLLGVEADGRLV